MTGWYYVTLRDCNYILMACRFIGGPLHTAQDIDMQAGILFMNRMVDVLMAGRCGLKCNALVCGRVLPRQVGQQARTGIWVQAGGLLFSVMHVSRH